MTVGTKATSPRKLRYAGLSDMGRVRRKNDDHWFADPEGQLFIVADGMGGHASGGLAAQIVVETLPRRLHDVLRTGNLPPMSVVAHKVAFEVARLSERIQEETQGEPGLAGMGTTVLVAVIWNREATLVHLGDSRAYLLRGGGLTLLTRDHTLIRLLIEEGQISPDEARVHPAKGCLTRFLGMEGTPIPDTTPLELQYGDRLLLCTDGLSGMLPPMVMERVLQSQEDPQHACRELVDQANAAGGEDNITAIVIAL